MKKQNGAVLIVTMILLVVMTILAVEGMKTSTMQILMTTNFQSKAQSFQWAENGLVDAGSYLAGNFDTASVGDTGTWTENGYTHDWEIIGSMDEVAMGVGETGFMVRSIGTFSMARTVLVAEYARIERPLATAAALSLHPAGSVTLYGNSTVSGLNWHVPADPDCNGNNCAGTLAGTDDSVGIYSDTDVGDLTEVGSTTLEGAPTTQNGGGACDQACWAAWAANIAPLATVHNGTQGDGSINWGTRDNPVIHVINEGMIIGSNLDSFGILIVDNVTLAINGNLHHEGLVVVIGDNVELIIGGTTRIFGSVIVASPDASIDVGATGTPGIFYSLEALNNLDTLFRVRRISWLEDMQG